MGWSLRLGVAPQPQHETGERGQRCHRLWGPATEGCGGGRRGVEGGGGGLEVGQASCGGRGREAGWHELATWRGPSPARALAPAWGPCTGDLAAGWLLRPVIPPCQSPRGPASPNAPSPVLKIRLPGPATGASLVPSTKANALLFSSKVRAEKDRLPHKTIVRGAANVLRLYHKTNF